MDLKDIAINHKKAEQGVWVEIDSETSFKIARFMNPEFNKLFQKLAPKSMAMKNNLVDLDDEKAAKIITECISKTILLDWKGLKIDGEEVEYSQEKCYEILIDERYVRLRQHVIELAREEEHFRDTEVNETVGKLEDISNGD